MDILISIYRDHMFFSCINICRVPRTLFEHGDPASVNVKIQRCVIVILAFYLIPSKYAQKTLLKHLNSYTGFSNQILELSVVVFSDVCLNCLLNFAADDISNGFSPRKCCVRPDLRHFAQGRHYRAHCDKLLCKRMLEKKPLCSAT